MPNSVVTELTNSEHEVCDSLQVSGKHNNFGSMREKGGCKPEEDCFQTDIRA